MNSISKIEKMIGIFFSIIFIYSNVKLYKLNHIIVTNFSMFKFQILYLLVAFVCFVLIFRFTKSDSKIVLLFLLLSFTFVRILQSLIYSSESFNDYLMQNNFLILIIGESRIFYIFSALLSCVYFFISKEKILFSTFFLLLIESIFVYVDFDSTITSLIRIAIGILFLIIFIFKKSKKFPLKEEKNE